MGWASLHAEYLLLPRCPVHDTVIIFLFVTLLMIRGHTWFSSFRCYGCGRPTRETLGFDVFAPFQKRPGGITANVHRCTLCLKVDRAYNPYHSYPCCGVYGCRRAAYDPIMTLTQVACQVARRRPCYAFMTGKFFSFLDHDPL